MRIWRSVGASIVFLGICHFYSSIALAQEVSLELRGGTFRITGKLLSYDGNNFAVDSKTLGTLTISAEKFRCIEGECPIESVAGLSDDLQTLHIAGSSTVAAMLPGLIREYAGIKNLTVGEIGDREKETIELRSRDGTVVQKIELLRKSSDFAFAALAKDSTDIGMASRPITDTEIGNLAEAGHPDMNRVGRQHVIALDGLVVLVSRDNPVNSLSIEDLARIYSGEVTNWSELGWEDQPIKIYKHGENSGMNATFSMLVLDPFRRGMTSKAISHRTNEDIAEAVAADRGGIGFVSFSQDHRSKALNIKDGCGITHKPTRFSVKAGEYPLSRELYFYTTQINRTDVADFVGFSASESGYDAVRDAGFINRSIAISAFDEFIERIVISLIAPREDFDVELMRQLAQDLGDGIRLSSTIRFEQSGDVQITSELSQQLTSILNYISGQDLMKNQIVLAGFSDSTGDFAANLAVSLQRANAVRDALLAPGRSELKPDDVVAKAYGELLPVACNDTSAGRSKNRRVEVWLVPRRIKPVALNRQP